jgi:hypothetical protein
MKEGGLRGSPLQGTSPELRRGRRYSVDLGHGGEEEVCTSSLSEEVKSVNVRPGPLLRHLRDCGLIADNRGPIAESSVYCLEELEGGSLTIPGRGTGRVNCRPGVRNDQERAGEKVRKLYFGQGESLSAITFVM